MNTTNTLLEIVTKQHLPKFNIDLITNNKNTTNKDENETSNKVNNDESIEKNINKTTDSQSDNKNELIDYKEIKKEVDIVFNNDDNNNNNNHDNHNNNNNNTYSVPQLKKLFNI